MVQRLVDRVFVMLAALLLGAMAVGALTVVPRAARGTRRATGNGSARVGPGRLRHLAARRQVAAGAARAGPALCRVPSRARRR